MRADRLLVERGLASSRTKAQELIEQGRVQITRNGQIALVKKTSQDLGDDVEIKILASTGPEFVSRGGIKLHGALKHVALDVHDLIVLDVGQSTGGFTDCLLQAGARRVIGIDVGHNQLAAKLKDDPRITMLEGINARELRASKALTEAARGEKFDLAVADVSFISLRLVLPEMIHYLKDSGWLLSLVKPQFEVGRENLGKNGIVKDEKLFDEVREMIINLCKENSLDVKDYFASSIEGSDGNKEFFVFARKSSR
jgi:23S rRNA (cytidine1920-2'-O)/16S rRNA (cytidine1409-2'-O)-methyltransferase